jgi:ABC-type branched-chain amino acid transport systems, periplasmic component
VIPHLKAKGVPFIGPSTGAELLHTPVNRLVFNVRAKYQLEAEKAVVQLATMGINKIGVIYVQDSFGKDAFEGAQKGFKAANLQPASVSTYDRTTSKVDGAVQEMLKTQPNAGMLFGSGSAIADIVNQVRKAGSTMQLVTISNNSSGAFVKSLGQNANGVIVTQVFPNPKMTTTPIATEMLKLASAKPEFIVSHQAMEGYAAAKVLVEGLKRAGKNPTRESLIAGLDTIRGYDLGGLSISYSPTDHTGIEYVELSIIGKRGDFVQR